MTSASDILYKLWQEYAKAHNFLQLGTLIKKPCERCGREMIVNCRKYNGVLYAERKEVCLCYECRHTEKEQTELSAKLAMALS